MPTPRERTRNLLQVGAFLRELEADKRLPKAIRNEARRLLRHYPTLASIDLAALIDRRFACSYQLTADIDPEWWKNYRFGVHTELRSPGTPISRKPHPREAPQEKGQHPCEASVMCAAPVTGVGTCGCPLTEAYCMHSYKKLSQVTVQHPTRWLRRIAKPSTRWGNTQRGVPAHHRTVDSSRRP